MMHCPEPESIALLVGGDLDSDSASQVEAHLAACEACAALYRDLSEDAAVLAIPPTVDPAAASRLQLRVSTELRRSSSQTWRRLAVAAAIVVAVLAGYSFRGAFRLATRVDLTVAKVEPPSRQSPRGEKPAAKRPVPPEDVRITAKLVAKNAPRAPRIREHADRLQPSALRPDGPVDTDGGAALIQALDQLMQPKSEPRPYAGENVVAMQTADPQVTIILLPEGD